MDKNKARWHAIRSKPHKEDFLYQQLITREIKVYYPTIQVKPVNPRSRTEIPYFPEYMFVHLDISKMGIRALNRIPGSIGLVHFGDSVPCVPEKVLEGIQQSIQVLGNLNGKETHKHHPGEEIRITQGPLQGYTAIFDTYVQGHERVRVLLEMLSDRKVALELGCNAID